MQDHRQTRGIELQQETDTLRSHMQERYARVAIGREHGRCRILYRHEIFPQE
jgi:hypothetical protein